jgi:hypothetical protein
MSIRPHVDMKNRVSLQAKEKLSREKGSSLGSRKISK